MEPNFTSKAIIQTNAPASKVWRALTDPETIKQFMVGTVVETDWNVGSPIAWKGEYNGKAYEDKGTILRFDENHFLEYSHFSPTEGKPDVPENYHTVSIEISEEDGTTTVALSQDKNPTEAAALHTSEFWQKMLDTLKEIVEK